MVKRGRNTTHHQSATTNVNSPNANAMNDNAAGLATNTPNITHPPPKRRNRVKNNSKMNAEVQQRRSPRVAENRLRGTQMSALDVSNDHFQMLYDDVPLYSTLLIKNVSLDSPQIFMNTRPMVPMRVTHMIATFVMKLPEAYVRDGSFTMHNISSIKLDLTFAEGNSNDNNMQINVSRPDPKKALSLKTNIDRSWIMKDGKQKASLEIMRILKDLRQLSVPTISEKNSDKRDEPVQTELRYEIDMSDTQRIGPQSLSTMLPMLGPYLLMGIVLKYSNPSNVQNSNEEKKENLEGFLNSMVMTAMEAQRQEIIQQQSEYQAVNSNAELKSQIEREERAALKAMITETNKKHKQQLADEIAQLRERSKKKIESRINQSKNGTQMTNNSMDRSQQSLSFQPSPGSSRSSRSSRSSGNQTTINAPAALKYPPVFDKNALDQQIFSISKDTYDFLTFASEHLNRNFILEAEADDQSSSKVAVELSGDDFMEVSDIFYAIGTDGRTTRVAYKEKEQSEGRNAVSNGSKFSRIVKEVNRLRNRLGNLTKSNVDMFEKMTIKS